MSATETIVIKKSVPNVHVGIDIGSTTTKLVAIDSASNEVLFSYYGRHHACQTNSVIELFTQMLAVLPSAHIRAAVCGSGGLSLAKTLGLPYIQEVVANATAIRSQFPQTRTAIELGGQDAKMLFFTQDAATGELDVSDMRMNGSCAGGTGAFLDEIAALLKAPIESFNALAEAGSTHYDISGRCGVFAKTDIQPLLNQGVRKSDIALSTFHALAKQTIGGLAQGVAIEAPVIFSGGPLTFNPALIKVFAERLDLAADEVLIPDHPETLVAFGAALSLNELFLHEEATLKLDAALDILRRGDSSIREGGEGEQPFFLDDEEQAAFLERHALDNSLMQPVKPGSRVSCFLGIDSGSTTTKFALIDEQGQLFDSFYASNQGEPLEVLKDALYALHKRYEEANVTLDILSVGTTGYGELLFAKALGADFHNVETVAHMRAAQEYVPDVSFILDIGGQDMKAIWVDDGVITNIVVNEACSSGCGSFLEGFASSLGTPTHEIATRAFASQSPAMLGSRCTVFMNSSIVSEQKNGKTPDDILAGLCKSIIKNVFTKVVRISNTSSLGNKIVVQGGTFQNDAVLRALEEYLSKEVVRAPHPGLMGAIGVALLAQEDFNAQFEQTPNTQHTAMHGTCSHFVGLAAMEDFSYEQSTNILCPHCSNHCSRTRITFSNGASWVTGNKCSKGEVFEDTDASSKQRQSAQQALAEATPDLMKEREQLLFKHYPYEQVDADKGITIGIPRVLSYWETMPFWKTFFLSLGFEVKVSKPSTRTLYERGLSAVTSDTVCFPAKLVHGHLRDLVDQRVNRIFMPSITTVASQNTEKTSESMCAVVKGYPLVIRNSDNPEHYADVSFDEPLFHWYTTEDRDAQLAQYMQQTYGVTPECTHKALAQADAAQASFYQTLEARGKEVLEEVEQQGGYAIVLAARPYHTDPLVHHGLSRLFIEQGIPVLTVDAVPGQSAVDLSKSRLDIVNNYHARMLSTSILTAKSTCMEYVQVVSFGCGHDAYLSDEIFRLMEETGGKAPLILKLDESDIQGPLRIRVRSFLETIRINRAKQKQAQIRTLSDPYAVKFKDEHKTTTTILVPNTSHAFCRLMTAAFVKQGFKAEPLDIGREEAIRLGKKYVHNDICFPAQIVIGESLAALESGAYDTNKVAIGMAKYVGDCRLTHYSALLRKALDDAGYAHVPIITNDDVDSHDMHPGFKMNLLSATRIVAVLPMIDALEELLRKIRPYERVTGATEAAFEQALDYVIDGLEQHGAHGARKGFKQAIALMKTVAYDRSKPRPRVLIVGEYLLNFHPGANNDIELYLENNGLEIIEARMTDVIRKTYFYKHAQNREYDLNKPTSEKAFLTVAHAIFEHAHDVVDRIACDHPLYEPAMRMPELVKNSDQIIHHTFDAGEGVLIPGEIMHHAERGCEAFVILQPFGCLPNHVVGRGITKRLKELYPSAHLLALDYDPDVSFANIENRLQMLIMSVLAKADAPLKTKDLPPDDTHSDDDDFIDEGSLNLDFIDWDRLLSDAKETRVPLSALVSMRKGDPLFKSLRNCAQYYKLYMAVALTRVANHAAGAASHVADAASHVADKAADSAAQAMQSATASVEAVAEVSHASGSSAEATIKLS